MNFTWTKIFTWNSTCSVLTGSMDSQPTNRLVILTFFYYGLTFLRISVNFFGKTVKNWNNLLLKLQFNYLKGCISVFLTSSFLIPFSRDTKITIYKRAHICFYYLWKLFETEFKVSKSLSTCCILDPKVFEILRFYKNVSCPTCNSAVFQ